MTSRSTSATGCFGHTSGCWISGPGTLSRSAEWTSPAGRTVRVTSVRLGSFTPRAMAAVSYQVEPVGGPARGALQSELVANQQLPPSGGDPRGPAAGGRPPPARRTRGGGGGVPGGGGGAGGTERGTERRDHGPPGHIGGDQYPLLLHFPYFELYRKQVVKQADLVLAMQLRPDAFGGEQKARNFAYYEGLTVRDSSLSASSQAVQAAEAGHPGLDCDYLADAALLDLDDLQHHTRDRLHIAPITAAGIA